MSTAASAPSGPTSGLAVAQQVIGEIVAHQPVGDFDQPPGQRRQLVVAELPFAAVQQRFDQIERQVGVEQARQQRPHRGVQPQESGKGPPRAGSDPGGQGEAADCRHRLKFQTAQVFANNG
jgi:hypothetical protein